MTNFHNLPAEARNRIYTNTILENEPIRIDNSTPITPALLRTSQDLRAEAIQMYWYHNTHIIDLSIHSSVAETGPSPNSALADEAQAEKAALLLARRWVSAAGDANVAQITRLRLRYRQPAKGSVYDFFTMSQPGEKAHLTASERKALPDSYLGYDILLGHGGGATKVAIFDTTSDGLTAVYENLEAYETEVERRAGEIAGGLDSWGRWNLFLARQCYGDRVQPFFERRERFLLPFLEGRGAGGRGFALDGEGLLELMRLCCL